MQLVFTNMPEFERVLGLYKRALGKSAAAAVNHALERIAAETADNIKQDIAPRNTTAKIERLKREYKLASWWANQYARFLHQPTTFGRGYETIKFSHRRVGKMRFTKSGAFTRTSGRAKRGKRGHLVKWTAENRDSVSRLILGRRKGSVWFLSFLAWSVWKEFRRKRRQDAEGWSAPGARRAPGAVREIRGLDVHVISASLGDLRGGFVGAFPIKRRSFGGDWSQPQAIIDRAMVRAQAEVMRDMQRYAARKMQEALKKA